MNSDLKILNKGQKTGRQFQGKFLDGIVTHLSMKLYLFSLNLYHGHWVYGVLISYRNKDLVVIRIFVLIKA